MTHLAPPPATPNCVHSAVDPSHSAYIAPLPIPKGGFEEAKRLVLDMPRTHLKEEEDGYAHIVFTTMIFRWKDDLKLELDPAAGVIHVRSASRVGHSDLGANRKRVEALRAAFEAA